LSLKLQLPQLDLKALGQRYVIDTRQDIRPIEHGV